jgi:NAD(P)-dependent dehydrogenase (short-subunit alcohol dehydrogenase family)
MLLANRVAIVTGGATGIGRGIALKFAKEGCSIVVADILEKEGKATVEDILKLGSQGFFISCDVTSSRQIQDMVNQCISRFGKIDILVNNAGGISTASAAIEEVTEEQWDKILNLNLKSQFLCCKAVVPHMKQKKYGKIINMSSIGAISPPVSFIHYHCAKAGVLGLTVNLAVELASLRICVNSILPGPIQTHFWNPLTAGMPNTDEFFAGLASKEVPMQRVGTPEDIAGTALYLASELSDYVTGESIFVSGGLPLHVSSRNE